MATKTAKKAAAKKAAVKKPAAKKAATPAPAAATYPWLRNRLASSLAKVLPAEHAPTARKAFKELTTAGELFTAAAEFGFDNSEEGLRTFLDAFVADGVTGKEE